MDSLSIMSDLTDTDCSDLTENRLNILQSKLDDKLNAYSKDELKDLCNIKNIVSKAKNNKVDLKNLLLDDYKQYKLSIKISNMNKLKDICRDEKLVGFSSLKKDELIIMILNSYIDKLILQNTSINNIDRLPFAQTQGQVQEVSDPDTLRVGQKTSDQESINLLVTQDTIKKTTKKTKTNDLIDSEVPITNDINIEIARLISLKEKIEKEEKERIEKERIEKERIEQERIEKERMDKEKLDKEKEELEKKKKAVIPKAVKTAVWELYIGPDIVKHRCLCCKKSYIKNTEFHVGHVISEKYGGTLEISNLRPICAPCNYSMSTDNMIEYIKKYGYYL